MSLKTSLTLLLILLLSSTQGFSDEQDNLDSVVDGIQKKYEQINNFHATFIQEVEVKALNKVQKADGEV